MINPRRLILAGTIAGVALGQGMTAAQAGPLLDRAADGPPVRTAAIEPVELTDETMDEVAAGTVLVPAVVIRRIMTMCSLLPSSYC